jgi:DNA-binding NtrC family response regulator
MSSLIPNHAELADEPALSVGTGGSGSPAEEAKTILLVDDDAMTLTVCGGCLEEAGYCVLKARSGEEAIRLNRQHAGPIHLLLTDYILAPKTLQLQVAGRRTQSNAMNGLHLMREIQAARPSTQVIVMSGHSDANLESLYHPKNGRSFLKKPFNLETLLRLVREAMTDRCPA